MRKVACTVLIWICQPSLTNRVFHILGEVDRLVGKSNHLRPFYLNGEVNDVMIDYLRRGWWPQGRWSYPERHRWRRVYRTPTHPWVSTRANSWPRKHWCWWRRSMSRRWPRTGLLRWIPPIPATAIPRLPTSTARCSEETAPGPSSTSAQPANFKTHIDTSSGLINWLVYYYQD